MLSFSDAGFSELLFPLPESAVIHVFIGCLGLCIILDHLHPERQEVIFGAGSPGGSRPLRGVGLPLLVDELVHLGVGVVGLFLVGCHLNLHEC